MPRTCLACASPERREIDKAIVAGEPLRKIAENFPISMTALHRHKPHVSQAIVKAEEKREERLGDNLIEGMSRIQRKLWEILAKMEASGDHRGEVVALREVRETMESQNKLLEKAQGSGPAEVRVLIEHVGAPGA